MKYPTVQEIPLADRIQICRWWRFLPVALSEEESEVIRIIYDRLSAIGGFTPEISKLIGLKE